MLKFGLITEGITDQMVIKNILLGVFNDADLPVSRLLPANDELGNWEKVFNYCRSEEFKQAFASNDYLIVQVDTDVLVGKEISKDYGFQFPPNPTVEELVEKVSEFLISLVNDGSGFWEEYGERVIFAISVNQIECWLLPIYFKSLKAKAAKTTGCIETLNEALPQQEGFYIDPKAKNPQYYTTISKKVRKETLKVYHLNPSLNIFVEHLLAIKDKNTPQETA